MGVVLHAQSQVYGHPSNWQGAERAICGLLGKYVHPVVTFHREQRLAAIQRIVQFTTRGYCLGEHKPNRPVALLGEPHEPALCWVCIHEPVCKRSNPLKETTASIRYANMLRAHPKCAAFVQTGFLRHHIF